MHFPTAVQQSDSVSFRRRNEAMETESRLFCRRRERKEKMVAILSSFLHDSAVEWLDIYHSIYGKFKRKYAKSVNCTIRKRRFENLIVSYTYSNLPVIHIIKFLIVYLYN